MSPLLLLEGTRDVVHHVAAWGGLVAEAAGIAIIIFGAVIAVGVFLRRLARRETFDSFEALRRRLGRAILLGLEFLVAADIIGTVLIEPTFRNLGILGLLVVIRTFLSFSLTVEIEGRWPWQKKGHNRTTER